MQEYFPNKKNKQKYLIALSIILFIVFAPGVFRYMDRYDAMEKELNRRGANVVTAKVEPINLPTKAPVVAAPQSKPETSSKNIDVAPLDSMIDASNSLVSSDMVGPFQEPVAEIQPAAPKVATPVVVAAAPKKNIVLITNKPKVTDSFAVQVASFTNQKSANDLVNKLKANTFKTTVKLVTINKKTYYRVFIIPENATKLSAVKLNQKLFQQYKINGYIRKIKV